MSSRIEEHKFFGFHPSQGDIASKGTQCLDTQCHPLWARPSAWGHLDLGAVDKHWPEPGAQSVPRAQRAGLVLRAVPDPGWQQVREEGAPPGALWLMTAHAP